MKNASAPRGTFDVLPTESPRWLALERIVDETCARFGYGEIRTPVFESTEVFSRTIGEGTDIVEKEMYTFVDRGGRSVTLRPEFTAPLVRAVLEHHLLESLPLKLYCKGPIFRYERPQKGRFRQSHQWDVECFGVAGPEADAEIIALGMEVVERVGIREPRLEINSMGCATCRVRYREELVKFLGAHAARLSETSRERLARNPLRILDSKDPGDKAVLANAPTIDAFWCRACADHFAQVRRLLEAIGVRAIPNPRIVRGFDYYTRTVFEISSPALGAQNAVCGGGRYDGLVELMGGPPTPGVGLAMGMERLLMVAEAAAPAVGDGRTRIDVAFVALDEQSARALVPVLHAVRKQGVAADMDDTLRKVEKQLRAAGQSGARFAVIVGSDERASGEATIQDLASRERVRVKIAELPDAIARRLSAS